jgi:hypothetical protein
MTHEPWNFAKRTAFILSVVVAVVILSLAILVSLFTFKHRFPHPSPPLVRYTYEEHVREGDAEFNNFRYEIAYQLYQKAERELAELSDFENQSPSNDIKY